MAVIELMSKSGSDAKLRGSVDLIFIGLGTTAADKPLGTILTSLGWLWVETFMLLLLLVELVLGSF